MKGVLNNNALVIHKCDDDQCVRNRMCLKITYSHNCCSLLIISSTKVHDYYFVIILPLECKWCAMPEYYNSDTNCDLKLFRFPRNP